MTDWTLMLIAMPILAGSGGHLTAIPMVDLTNCMQGVLKMTESDMKDGLAYLQAVCMPQDDAQKFMVAARCHDPDKHQDPPRLDMSCEGVGVARVSNDHVPSVVLPESKRK